jgi:acetylornithine deacetylase/succinyl-diaminopimelate desuccinylase-like protein
VHLRRDITLEKVDSAPWLSPGSGDSFAHGFNEKLPASEVEAGLEFWHRVLTQLAR